MNLIYMLAELSANCEGLLTSILVNDELTASKSWEDITKSLIQASDMSVEPTDKMDIACWLLKISKIEAKDPEHISHLTHFRKLSSIS